MCNFRSEAADIWARTFDSLIYSSDSDYGDSNKKQPDFPLPMGALAPLRAKAEQQGRSDFTPFWSGQGSPLGREMPAMELTLKLVQEAVERMKQLRPG